MTKINKKENLQVKKIRLSPTAIKRADVHARRLGISRAFLIELLILIKSKDLKITEIKKKGLIK